MCTNYIENMHCINECALSTCVQYVLSVLKLFRWVALYNVPNLHQIVLHITPHDYLSPLSTPHRDHAHEVSSIKDSLTNTIDTTDELIRRMEECEENMEGMESSVSNRMNQVCSVCDKYCSVV